MEQVPFLHPVTWCGPSTEFMSTAPPHFLSSLLFHAALHNHADLHNRVASHTPPTYRTALLHNRVASHTPHRPAQPRCFTHTTPTCTTALLHTHHAGSHTPPSERWTWSRTRQPSSLTFYLPLLISLSSACPNRAPHSPILFPPMFPPIRCLCSKYDYRDEDCQAR
jgi:hypothetical protein